MSAFDEKIKSLIANVDNLAESEVEKTKKLLEKARKNIASKLVATDWDAHRVSAMQSAVSDAMSQFADKYNASLADAVSDAWTAGLGMVESATVTAVPITNLEILQGYSADRITNMTAEMTEKINDIISVGMASGDSLQQVMREIGNNITDASVFRTIAGRSEAIARTEIATVNNAAIKARSEEVIRLNPDKKFVKMWLHSLIKKGSRLNHIKLHKVTVPIDKDFSKVGGKQPVPAGSGFAYPHSPGMKADQVVNCRCVFIVKLKQ